MSPWQWLKSVVGVQAPADSAGAKLLDMGAGWSWQERVFYLFGAVEVVNGVGVVKDMHEVRARALVSPSGRAFLQWPRMTSRREAAVYSPEMN